MRSWQLQEAKARFSEVVKAAQQEGPQEISVRGEPTAVLVSRAEFDRLRRPRPSLVEFLRTSPLAGVELDLARDPTPARAVRL
ncbi:MAG: type II toxin-antitoxin system Phd/YefM family antitoxin [Actinomycetes bacterium]